MICVFKLYSFRVLPSAAFKLSHKLNFTEVRDFIEAGEAALKRREGDTTGGRVCICVSIEMIELVAHRTP